MIELGIVDEQPNSDSRINSVQLIKLTKAPGRWRGGYDVSILVIKPGKVDGLTGVTCTKQCDFHITPCPRMGLLMGQIDLLNHPSLGE